MKVHSTSSFPIKSTHFSSFCTSLIPSIRSNRITPIFHRNALFHSFTGRLLVQTISKVQMIDAGRYYSISSEEWTKRNGIKSPLRGNSETEGKSFLSIYVTYSKSFYVIFRTPILKALYKEVKSIFKASNPLEEVILNERLLDALYTLLIY